MKIGVLGSGDVARTLASGFLKHGHQVILGSRTPDKLADWAEKNRAGKTGTFAEAAAFGELRRFVWPRRKTWPGRPLPMHAIPLPTHRR
jgi:6-phosphogluconate dehydrogenase (decarboxylating)